MYSYQFKQLGAKINSEQSSLDDLDQISDKLQKIETSWFACNSQIKEIHEDVVKAKEILNLLSQNVKPLLKNLVKDAPNKVVDGKQEPKLDDLFSEEIDEKQKISIYVNAMELMSKKKKDFIYHKDCIDRKKSAFEVYHGIIQTKMEHLEKFTPEMFLKCEKIERENFLIKVVPSEDDVLLQIKCCELYEAVKRDNNMLRITYGLPAKAEQNKVDEIENKVAECNLLCRKLEYSIY